MAVHLVLVQAVGVRIPAPQLILIQNNIMNNKLKIFSGRSNPALAKKISKSLGCELGEISISTFSDGELWIKFEENIRGTDVFLIQSTNGPSENILELALMVDAAVRASADRVTVVIPYFGYGRQDRKDQPRVPISSRVMIDIFTAMGADRIITMDLHSTQIQGLLKSRLIIYTAEWCYWMQLRMKGWIRTIPLCWHQILDQQK